MVDFCQCFAFIPTCKSVEFPTTLVNNFEYWMPVINVIIIVLLIMMVLKIIKIIIRMVIMNKGSKYHVSSRNALLWKHYYSFLSSIFHFTCVKWHASVKTLALVKQLIIMILIPLKIVLPHFNLKLKNFVKCNLLEFDWIKNDDKAFAGIAILFVPDRVFLLLWVGMGDNCILQL